MSELIDKPESLSLLEVLNGTTRQYRIPIYQRDYAWESDQIEDLLNDIFVFTASSEGPAEHFFGTVVLSKNSPGAEEGNGDARFVIDGQQRLTTCVLLLAVIRHLAHEFTSRQVMGCANLTGELLQYTSLLQFTPDQTRLPKIWANRVNQEFLTGVLDGSTDDKSEVEALYESLSADVSERSKRLFEAYEQIRSTLEGRFRDLHDLDKDAALLAM